LIAADVVVGALTALRRRASVDVAVTHVAISMQVRHATRESLQFVCAIAPGDKTVEYSACCPHALPSICYRRCTYTVDVVVSQK